MLEQLKLLIEIQILQDKKAQLIRDREEMPKNIAELEREYKRFEGEYLLKKAELEHAQKMRKSLEHDIADMESKSVRSKQRMSEVKTNKEYQALLKEIDDMKRDVAEKEDGILDLMEKLDSLGKDVKGLEAELEKRGKILDEDKAKLQAQSDMVNDRLGRLEAMQDEVRAKLEPDLLRKCDFLMKRQSGIAVAAVLNGTCQICHLNIPPQKFNELQRDDAIMQCPHCHRFIYWPGHEGYKVLQEEFEGA